MVKRPDDDAFEDSPVPRKRRRAVRRDDVAADSGSESHFSVASKDGKPAKRPRSAKASRESSPKKKPKKTPKPKHRIRIVEPLQTKTDRATVARENDLLMSSQPWMLRDAIWKQPQRTEPTIKPEVREGARSPLADRPAVNLNSNGTRPPVKPPPRANTPTPTLAPVNVAPPPLEAPSTAPAAATAPPDESDYGSDDFQSDLEILSVVTRPVQPVPPNLKAEKTAPPVQPTLGPPNGAALLADEFDVAAELADLPSDAFSSSSPPRPRNEQADHPQPGQANLAAPRKGLVQQTLFGETANGAFRPSQADKRVNFTAPIRNEPPTHHALDKEAMKTWVYPMNLGTVRDYQYNIVARGLFNNLLVALPTGLGKTFIAATIMLNWLRWTKDAQIVFVAPTKPLVSQQVEACFQVAGIPRSMTTLLTGSTAPGLRAEEWASKRVFFMTPQTLVNDLKTGACDPKRLVLLVIDEAHRATGNYAYVEVVRFLRRFTQSFRVLALTATPGNTVPAVQTVIDSLGIARVEIRTEFSLDIRQYIHSKNTDRKIFRDSEEMVMAMEFFSKAVNPVLAKLCSQNAYWNRDPLSLTAYGLTQARQKWAQSEPGRNASYPVKTMVQRIFSVLASLAHGVDLLKYHGIGPFYHNMARFRDANTSAQTGKYEKEILESEHFQRMMTRLQFWMKSDTFVGHPKLEFLQASVLEHFANEHVPDGDTTKSATRVMIFAHFRDSAEEIVRVLKRHSPMIRPHVFVGQAASKDSEGMDQKRQSKVIDDFKAGTYNTLVATSIGEEGLDIGEVDLIVCYDSSASPIRMLQRMGRTGRKRAGKILLLLMQGKEENSYITAKDSYEKMQRLIAEGSQFEFHEEQSPRILPREAQPALDKRIVDIPVENSQAELPEPSRKGKRAPKRPPKRFNMPDGVRTGFVRASRIDDDDDEEGVLPGARQKTVLPSEDLEVPPDVEDVCLTMAERKEFERNYVNVVAGTKDVLIEAPSVTKHSEQQRRLGVSSLVSHSAATKKLVAVFRPTPSARATRLDTLKAAVPNDNELLRLCGPINAVSPAPSNPRSSPPSVPTKPTRPAKPGAKRQTAGPAAKPTPKPGPTRQHSGPAAKPPPKPRGRPRKARAEPLLAAAEGSSSSPPPTDPRMRIASQAVTLGSADTSGEDEPDGDGDAASDLDGWLVASDAEISEAGEEPGTDEVVALGRAGATPASDSEDESLPDLDEYADARRTGGARGRRVVTDSDEEGTDE